MSSDALKPLPPDKWDAQKAQHLLNRAGFGIPRERVQFLTQLGHTKSVKSLIHYESIPKHGESPQFLVPDEDYLGIRDIKDEQERREYRSKITRKERQAMNLLKQWWLERMLYSPRPLEEKMTLFWHGHFATSAQKVRRSQTNEYLHNQFRLYATGNFKDLTTAVAKSPAMLHYLDNTHNVKAHPNENWARELMELFTLGIGNYTEDDIKESARAFTGWTSTKGDVFYVNERNHDTGSKTFLGQTGNFNGEDIIDIIFEQPATATFICKKLYTFFVHEEPDDAVIEAMATEFRAQRYEIKPVLEKLFLSKAFYSKHAMGSQIKSPAQFIVQLTHDMNITSPPYTSMARATAQLGQDLFYPPNVKGWDGGRMWINANTLLTRYNLPVTLGKANGEMEMMRMEESMMGNMSPEQEQKQRRDEFMELMLTLPEKQAQKIREHMQSAETPKERQAIYHKVFEKYATYDSWEVARVFDTLKFTTAQECINALTQRFLTQPLNPEQQHLLARSLGVSDLATELSHQEVSKTQMNATLHLLLSTAEYQLC